MKLLEQVTDDTGATHWALVVRTHRLALLELLRHPWASLLQVVLWLRESHEGGIG